MAKHRGVMALGGKDGMIAAERPLFLSQLWLCCPLDDWKEELDYTCPSPSAPSVGV